MDSLATAWRPSWVTSRMVLCSLSRSKNRSYATANAPIGRSQVIVNVAWTNRAPARTVRTRERCIGQRRSSPVICTRSSTWSSKRSLPVCTCSSEGFTSVPRPSISETSWGSNFSVYWTERRSLEMTICECVIDAW